VAAAAVTTTAALFAASDSAAGEGWGVEEASLACALVPKSRVEPTISEAAFL
jgi:hypothetical protein